MIAASGVWVERALGLKVDRVMYTNINVHGCGSVSNHSCRNRYHANCCRIILNRPKIFFWTTTWPTLANIGDQLPRKMKLNNE